MSELPEERRKGYKIMDENGNHICDVARDLKSGVAIFKLSDFTNWSIPQPVTQSLVHPALLKLYRGKLLKFLYGNSQ